MDTGQNSQRTSETDAAQAAEIVRVHFSRGLEALCNERFLAKRYSEFKKKNDPIYATLMDGMGDEQLAKTFVSYWTIGQTLSVKSRFWLEDAIFDIIRARTTAFGQQVTHVYNQKMLGNQFLLKPEAIADIGEERLQNLQKKTWEVLLKRNALREADIIVGEQERGVFERADVGNPFLRRVWMADKPEDRAIDREALSRVEKAIAGEQTDRQKLLCSLLVVEPDKHDNRPHVTAYRFINPKTFASHDVRKQERVNLLRLHAYLCQEKPFRDPASIKIYVTEIVPRDTGGFDAYDHYPDYFTSETYLSSDEFWKRMGVPFSKIQTVISEVAREFRNKLIKGLRKLLPDDTKQKSGDDMLF
jgi:hypothetical protein